MSEAGFPMSPPRCLSQGLRVTSVLPLILPVQALRLKPPWTPHRACPSAAASAIAPVSEGLPTGRPICPVPKSPGATAGGPGQEPGKLTPVHQGFLRPDRPAVTGTSTRCCPGRAQEPKGRAAPRPEAQPARTSGHLSPATQPHREAGRALTPPPLRRQASVPTEGAGSSPCARGSAEGQGLPGPQPAAIAQLPGNTIPVPPR